MYIITLISSLAPSVDRVAPAEARGRISPDSEETYFAIRALLKKHMKVLPSLWDDFRSR